MLTLRYVAPVLFLSLAACGDGPTPPPPPPANNAPTAAFSMSCTALSCTFTDQSTDSDGSIASRSWDFGDGGSSSAQSPSHTYSSAGNYSVALTVTDNDGATGNTSQAVTVSVANVPPTAAFSMSCTGLSCTFTDQSTDSDGTIASWSWNFGDGGSSSAQSPSHTYSSAGTYTVALTVTDNDGATGNTSQDVTVSVAVVPTIGSISPDPVVEGQSATITGTGFDPTPANNTVTIDGLAATVTGAAATSLTVTVPTYNCQPARDVDVVVTVSGVSTPPASHALEPPAFVSLAVGEQLIIEDPAEFCAQFAASASSEEYLIGVQSTSETPSSLTPITLAAAGPSPVSTAVALPAPVAASGGVAPQADERAIRWGKHRAAEAELRMQERRFLPRPPQGGGLRSVASQIPPTVQVGDTVPIRFPNISLDFCTNFISITTEVKFIGTRGIWLEDVANPAGGYSGADYQSLSGQLDNPIYDKDVEYFGSPTDLDGNSRIGIVITQEINKAGGLLGFVVGTDLVPLSVCQSSNEGEIFYGIAPDPTGAAGTPYLTADAVADAPFLIAHEFTHIIQFSRRIAASAPTFQSSWEAEGQATLAEEVVGHAYEGRSVGTDIGLGPAINLDVPSSVDWYSNAFVDMGRYFGWDGANGKVSGAPHECTWIGRPSEGNSGPCLGMRQVYGVTWSLLRWVSDQYGSSFPGGEQGIHQSLIGASTSGYANLAGVVGVPIGTLLAKWAATLYVDNRFTPTDPLLDLPSWDLFDIYYGSFAGVSLKPGLRLTPQTATFGSFSGMANVRAGSTYYTLISGSSRPATAVRARDGSGSTLPAFMQYWIVRTQ